MLDGVWNGTIREMMAKEKDIRDEGQKRQLIYFAHTERMDETRCPSKVPLEKCRRGRR
jgi:hypothetical protein